MMAWRLKNYKRGEMEEEMVLKNAEKNNNARRDTTMFSFQKGKKENE